MKFTRIKGENRPHSILRLPILGHIRLGVKVQRKPKTPCKHKADEDCFMCTYPKETDYFVVPHEVKKLYGDKPTELPCMLPTENEDLFFRQFYAVYGSNHKLKCMGDGEKCERRIEKKKVEMPCPHPENCDYGQDPKTKCRARTVISVVLNEINMGGVYQISTGSINSDIDIRSGIEMARGLYNRISWAPMLIKREDKKIPDPITGNMQTHWPVKLFPKATAEQVNMVRQDEKRIISHQERIALPEPIVEGKLPDSPIEVHADVMDEEKIKPVPVVPGSKSPTNESTLESQAATTPDKKEPAKPQTLEEQLMCAENANQIRPIWSEINKAKEAGVYDDAEYVELAKIKNTKKKQFATEKKDADPKALPDDPNIKWNKCKVSGPCDLLESCQKIGKEAANIESCGQYNPQQEKLL